MKELSQRSAWSPGGLKRKKHQLERQIRQAFCAFVSDCREVVAGAERKQQLDDDLRFVSTELSKHKKESAD